MNIQRRSNRPLTQYACDFLDDFLKDKLQSGRHRNENTSVECEISPKAQTLSVGLFGTEIMALSMMDGKPVSVLVSVGDQFTVEGYPKKTTIERLNGLLDELGCHGVIPTGVRIFKDREENMFYLGKGDDRVAVGRRLATCIRLEPDDSVFGIESTDLFPELAHS